MSTETPAAKGPSLLGTIVSAFVPGGAVLSPIMGFLGYILNPARLIVWVPLLFMAGSIIFAGMAVKNYVASAEASKAEVIQLKSDVATLSSQVQLERQSVDIATTNIQTYTKAVQTYAAKQQVYQAQIAKLKVALDPAKIVQKAQTDEKGATDDVNAEYNNLLGVFNDASDAATVASGGATGDSSKTTTTTTVTSTNHASTVASPQKRDTGP